MLGLVELGLGQVELGLGLVELGLGLALVGLALVGLVPGRVALEQVAPAALWRTWF